MELSRIILGKISRAEKFANEGGTWKKRLDDWIQDVTCNL